MHYLSVYTLSIVTELIFIYHSGPDNKYHETLLDVIEYNYDGDKPALQAQFDDKYSSDPSYISISVLDLLKLSTTTICFQDVHNAPLELNTTIYGYRGIKGKYALYGGYRLDWHIFNQHLSPYHVIGNREISNWELNDPSAIVKYRNYLTFDRLQLLANQLRIQLNLPLNFEIRKTEGSKKI